MEISFEDVESAGKLMDEQPIDLNDRKTLSKVKVSNTDGFSIGGGVGIAGKNHRVFDKGDDYIIIEERL